MAYRSTFPGLVALAIMLAGLLPAGGCSRNSETNEPVSRDVRCEVGRIELTSVPRHVTATGSLEAAQSVMVSTRMMGWVKRIHVTEGQRVRKGDPLLSIDDTDLMARKAQAEAGIAEAEAVLANAEKMAARFENLYADKSVSKQQLDDVLTGRDRAAAGVKMAQAGLRELKVHLSYLDLVAPIDGVIGRRMIEEGDMANPGMPLLILEETAAMKVVAHIGEQDVSAVAAGDPVIIDVTSLQGAEFESVLDKVVPTANPGSRTYDIEAIIPNEGGRLKSGMFARVKIPVGSRKAVLAPEEAIVRRGQLTGVWTVADDQTAHLRWIRLGNARDGRVEVLSGLDGGESVVLSHDQPLVEGDRVVR
ncbi:MAG: efflux RND transporter periplasmic adaptor subunit [Candidatus Krumholzibacteriia bacterium]